MDALTNAAQYWMDAKHLFSIEAAFLLISFWLLDKIILAALPDSWTNKILKQDHFARYVLVLLGLSTLFVSGWLSEQDPLIILAVIWGALTLGYLSAKRIWK